MINLQVNADAKNILILSYEQMKRDPHTSVNTLGDFLGYRLSKDVVSQIVEQTTFSNMKLNPAANNSWMEKYHKDEGATPFMRKGIIGDWKNYFSDEQSTKMDALVNEKVAGTDIVFDYGT
jgi:hypothetical protein